MRTPNRTFRVTAAFTASALALAQSIPQPGFAQGPPPQPTAGVSDQQAVGDPPARVGRLARTSGTVSFHGQDDDRWGPATANYPVTAGNAFWTEPNSQAEIEVSASRIAMAPATELAIMTLDDTTFQATEPQGEIYLHLHAAMPDEAYAVQTPRGLATFASTGRYVVAAGDTQTPTTITAIEGTAQISGPGLSMQVGPNQTATISGSDTFQGELGPAQHDAFLTAMLERERPPQPQQVAAPAAVAAMPGGDDLAQYGSWSQSPEYGQVWYPQVAQDWVPYREGHWAYVAPWGWTWVANEPWGFTPFHYGRWIQTGGRWGWYPGVAPAPVYAPALVTFFGVGAVAGVGIGAALAAGRIGWCPLGPREAYHPWYRASDRYVRQVNVAHVTNVTTVNRNVTINNFVNRGGATVVPASALTASRPVRPVAQRFDPAQFAQARPMLGQQPLRPTAATAGVTPAVARQLNLGPTPGAVVQHPVAPGPAIRPGGPVPGPVGNAATGRPPLPLLHNPSQPTVPAAVGARPFRGQMPTQPTLRAPVAPGQIGPPAMQHPMGGGAPAAVAHPGPQVTAPSVPTSPPPAFHPTARAPTVQTPPPPQVIHPAPPPPPVAHAAPPSTQAFRGVPMPQVQAPPPPAHLASPPPQFHPPPPAVHASPPPPAAQATHTPPQQQRQKRPGEP